MTSLRIRPFSGTADENIQQYINSVRSVFDLDSSASSTPFTPAIKAFYLSSNLEGKARRFVSQLDPAIVDDWEHLSQALLNKYRNNPEDKQAKRQAVFKLYELKQGPRTKLRDYIKRAKKIAGNLPEADKHLVVSKLIQGIHGKELRVHATSSVPVTASLDEATAAIYRISSSIRKKREEEDSESNESNSDTSDSSGSDQDSDDCKRKRRGRKGTRTRHSRSRQRLLMKAELTEATSRVEQRLTKELDELKSFLKEKVQPLIGMPTVPVDPRSMVDSYAVLNHLAQPGNSHQPEYGGPPPLPAGQAFGMQPQGPYQQVPPLNRNQQYAGFQGNQGPRPPRDRSTLTCYGCGQIGHYRSECQAGSAQGQGQVNTFPGPHVRGFNQGQRQQSYYGPVNQGGPQGYQGPAGAPRIQEVPMEQNQQGPAQVAAVDIATSAFDGVTVSLGGDENLAALVEEVKGGAPYEAMAGEGYASVASWNRLGQEEKGHHSRDLGTLIRGLPKRQKQGRSTRHRGGQKGNCPPVGIHTSLSV